MPLKRMILALWLICASSLISCAHTEGTREEAVPSWNLMKALIDFYQGPLNHCSAVRSGECPMHPSCSEYSKEAFQRYGFFIGAMIVSDRLMRCGRDETRLSPRVYVNGMLKSYDPLDRNTFWWDKE